MVGKISEIATSGSPLQGADRFELTRDPTGTPTTVWGDIDLIVTYANTNLSLDAARITSGVFADARIAQSNVTQHEGALAITGSQVSALPVELERAISDETTDLTTGTAKITFRMPFAMTVTEVRASVNTAPTGATIIVDINEGGVTILSTKLSIDAGAKTSTTALTPPVISDSALADDAEITVDIDQVGSTAAGKGLKVVLIGTRA